MDGTGRKAGRVSPVPWALACAVLWGSAAPFIKIGYRLFHITAFGQVLSFAGMRFVLAGLLVLGLASIRSRRLLLPEKADLLPILVLAAFQTFGQYWLYYAGLRLSSGVQAAILTGTGAFLSLLAAVFVFHYEALTWNKAAGCLLAFGGILVMNGTGKLNGAGALLLAASQICAALSAGLIKRYGQHHDPVLLSGWQFLAGGAGLWLTGHQSIVGTAAAWMDLLYLALVSGAAYTIWGMLLKKHAMSRITIFESVIPVAGVGFSAIFLQEWGQALHPGVLLALLLISGGIVLVHKKEKF